MEKITEPKILVISNNSFSTTENNGKTLSSLFREFKVENVAQIYMDNKNPDNTYYNKYYSIFYNREIQVENHEGTLKNNLFIDFIKSKLKKSNFARLIREIIWKFKFSKLDSMYEWIAEFSPDLIFYCAGDFEFGYDLVTEIQKNISTKLAVFITDDYILPRKTLNIFWIIRRKRLFDKMKKTLSKSDLFFTISEQMSTIYGNLFNVQSNVILNLTKSMKVLQKKEKKDNVLKLIYAGGLHLNRYKTLIKLTQAIQQYNLNRKSDQTRVYLEIYSNINPSKNIRNKLNKHNSSAFLGALNSSELKIKLNENDVLVHVEAFDKKSIHSTMLSISTKIPEYLSLEKPIFAIGPKEIASMQYLKDVSLCVNNPRDILKKLDNFIQDNQLRTDLATKAFAKYNDYHDYDINSKRLKESINRIFDSNDK